MPFAASAVPEDPITTPPTIPDYHRGLVAQIWLDLARIGKFAALTLMVQIIVMCCRSKFSADGTVTSAIAIILLPMSYSALLTTLLPVTAGAIIGFVPALVLQKRTQKHEIVTRWDSMLLTACVDLVDAARRTEHLADQIESGHTEEALLHHFDEIHQQVRVSVETLRILGDADLQLAARNILRSVYSRRRMVQGNPDPYAEQYCGVHPSDRLREHLLVFYKSARQQLHVSDAQDVPVDSNPGRPAVARDSGD